MKCTSVIVNAGSTSLHNVFCHRRCTSLLIKPRLQTNRGQANHRPGINISDRVGGKRLFSLLLRFVSVVVLRTTLGWVKLGCRETDRGEIRAALKSAARSSFAQICGGKQRRCSEIRPDLELERTLERGSALREQPSESLQEPAGN